MKMKRLISQTTPAAVTYEAANRQTTLEKRTKASKTTS